MTAPSMATNPISPTHHIAREVIQAMSRHTQYMGARFLPFGLVAFFGFPLYYFVWQYLFPQHYENLTLRLVGSGLFVPIILASYWPARWQRYLPIYWYFTLIYSLPFFFTFMLLKNEGSSAWLLSALAAAFLMVLLLDWRNLLFQMLLGCSLAWASFTLSSPDAHISLHVMTNLPVYLFVIALGAVSNYSSEAVKQERLRAMHSAASTLAHELRTPLLGIKAGANGVQLHLPTLLKGYQLAQQAGLPIQPIRDIHQEQLANVLKRIEEEVDHSNIIIDMLLANSDLIQFKQIAFTSCNMQTCLADALRRYPFASDQQRMLVHADLQIAFHFRGHELLMVHLLFNLLKNALRHITQAGKGEILIRSESGPEQNRLIFHDTGLGIPAHILPHIFTRFYSWSLGHDDGSGAGIGLAYCRSVMQAFGGSINCRSQSGEFCEFTLSFPR